MKTAFEKNKLKGRINKKLRVRITSSSSAACQFQPVFLGTDFMANFCTHYWCMKNDMKKKTRVAFRSTGRELVSLLCINSFS